MSGKGGAIRQLLRKLWLKSSYAHMVVREEGSARCSCGWVSEGHIADKHELNRAIADHAGWTF